MNLKDIITPGCVACATETTSKKRALEKLAGLISQSYTELTDEEIFESLIARERLGSTGIGHGVAIPHGRIHTDNKSIAAFMQLKDSVDFDAIDGQPVDLVFGLLVPEDSTDEHLKILAGVASLFSDTSICEQLRQATTNEELYNILASYTSPDD